MLLELNGCELTKLSTYCLVLYYYIIFLPDANLIVCLHLATTFNECVCYNNYSSVIIPLILAIVSLLYPLPYPFLINKSIFYMQGLNKLNVILEINKAEPIDKWSNQFQLYKYCQIRLEFKQQITCNILENPLE